MAPEIGSIAAFRRMAPIRAWGYARCRCTCRVSQDPPLQEQVRPGLEWVHKIVIDDDRTAAACGFLLVGWLHTIRGSLVEEAPKRWYREIVDALVLGRYVGARELQALDE